MAAQRKAWCVHGAGRGRTWAGTPWGAVSRAPKTDTAWRTPGGTLTRMGRVGCLDRDKHGAKGLGLPHKCHHPALGSAPP